MKTPVPFWLTIAILCIVSSIFLYASWYFGRRTLAFLQNGVPAKAEVIDFVDKRFTKQSRPVMAPKFRFQTTDGRTVEASMNSSSNPSPFDVGDTVDILYNPANPQEILPNTFKELWLIPLLLGFMGAVFLFPAILLIRGIRSQ